VPQVNKFLVTIDYTKTSTDAGAVADAGRFNWTPPSDAILVKIQPDAAGAGGGGSEAALALVGKPAPDFTLKDLAGKDVTLASLKGSVVVLDFWATWCGPCRASMPHLNTLNKDLSGRGLKLYAVNESETKAAVEQYLTAEKLTGLPVLMDETSIVVNFTRLPGSLKPL
jgi:thiol-disulfide isomerase/thioredoxin